MGSILRKTVGISALLVAVGICLGTSSSVFGAHTFTASDSYGREATVSFDVVGTELQVTLVNTSAADVVEPVGVLTAVFFDIPGATTLSASDGSAMIADGSTWLFDNDAANPGTAQPVGNVGTEWAFRSDIPSGYDRPSVGISSVGLGIFGPGDRFVNDLGEIWLDFPASPDGLNYGITSAGDDMTTGNAKVTGGVPLIQNSVVFTLSGIDAGFIPSADTILNTGFQYGTDLSEPYIVPEPSTVIAGVLLLLPFGLSTLRTLRRKRRA